MLLLPALFFHRHQTRITYGTAPCLLPFPSCYGLKCLCLPKFICWNPNSQREFGRWLSHERGALMNGISVFIKGIQRATLPLYAMRGCSRKTAICEPGSGLWLDTESACGFMLDFPASRTGKNKCALFRSPSLWYFYLKQLERTETLPQYVFCHVQSYFGFTFSWWTQTNTHDI